MTGASGAGAGAVLVLTARLDPTADLVVEELHRRAVPVFRCDPADFPTALSVAASFDGSGWGGELRTPRRSLDLAAVRCAYLRRPGRPAASAELSGEDREWADREARVGFDGLVAAVPRWLNHPDALAHAEHKPVQLAAAARAGLATPRTLVTNDPAAARRFVAGRPRAVYKAFCSPVTVGEEHRFVYTTVVGAADLDDDAIRTTAHQFQEWVDKTHEVRLTAVDGELFAARLTARSAAAEVDWRADYDAVGGARPAGPDQVRASVAALLAGLRLRFAAMDFAVRPTGEWVFLDLNPNGQWGWIEHETGLPITAAIAGALSAPGV